MTDHRHDVDRVLLGMRVHPNRSFTRDELNKWADLPQDRLAAALAVAVVTGDVVRDGSTYRRPKPDE